MSNIEIVKQYMGEKGHINNIQYNPQYCEAMINIRFENFSEDDLQYFKNIYHTSKNIFVRNQILEAFEALPVYWTQISS